MSAFGGPIGISKKAQRTHNPIRAIVDNLKPPKDHAKDMINLALGDPTVHGNLKAPKVLQDAVSKKLYEGTADGYIPSVGTVAARKAIAVYSGRKGKTEYTEDDICIASGCSGALDLVITALVDEGDNILVPQPGFPLYQVIAESLGGNTKNYALLPHKGWECDVQDMEAQIDENTKAILVNNPSNPTGSNYSEAHLKAICKVAKKHGLPIIADEIYGGVVFEGSFTPIATVSGSVPVLSVGGLAKEFVVPGWRVGWIVMHEVSGNHRLDQVRTGIKALSQIVIGANALVQAAIPDVLTPVAGTDEAASLAKFNSDYLELLRNNAEVCMAKSEECPQITCVRATGAMYAMLQIHVDQLDDSISNDEDFAGQLLQEENIFMLPGSCFGMPNYLRMVTCPPKARLEEAFDRINAFCQRHLAPADKKAKSAIKFTAPPLAEGLSLQDFLAPEITEKEKHRNHKQEEKVDKFRQQQEHGQRMRIKP